MLFHAAKPLYGVVFYVPHLIESKDNFLKRDKKNTDKKIFGLINRSVESLVVRATNFFSSDTFQAIGRIYQPPMRSQSTPQY